MSCGKKFFFISDTHFGYMSDPSPYRRDAYATAFTGHNFSTAKQYTDGLIKNWNAVVAPYDEVYFLGDVSNYDVQTTNSILSRLNGIKHLLIGNHDAKFLTNNAFRDNWAEIKQYKEVPMGDGLFVCLCHYPMLCFNGHYQGNFHFYGHLHNSWEETCIQKARKDLIEGSRNRYPVNMINVGAMMPWMRYTPQTFETLVTEIRNQ